MKKILVICTLVFAAVAHAEMPQLVTCHNQDGRGNTVSHRFEFQPDAREIFPPSYEIRISSSTSRGIIFDKIYKGTRDVKDADLIYFIQGGFIRIDRVSPQSEFAMTFQLPDQVGELAEFVGNCHLPEPRAGVGN
ncbi:MAG: hypothetical protein V4654_08430 [Bdellovibrionota bacterium]